MEKKDNRITCTAANCIYNNCDCGCTASKVSVGNEHATCCDQTRCATFKDRKTGK